MQHHVLIQLVHQLSHLIGRNVFALLSISFMGTLLLLYRSCCITSALVISVESSGYGMIIHSSHLSCQCTGANHLFLLELFQLYSLRSKSQPHRHEDVSTHSATIWARILTPVRFHKLLEINYILVSLAALYIPFILVYRTCIDLMKAVASKIYKLAKFDQG